jgi:hypothetical protein
MFKSLSTLLSISLIISGCSPNQNSNQNTPLPAVANPSNLKTFMQAKAEFDLSSSPNGTAQFNLIKKSYALATCTHGQCTDFTDITVTNNSSTQFALSSNSPVIQGTNNKNMSNLVTLKIGTLFDNDLTACGGFKCTAALIRVYTSDSTGVQGPVLWSQSIQKSVPLTISGGSSSSILANIPYFNAANPNNGSSSPVDMETLPVSQNVLSLAGGDFSDANANISANNPGYILSADFTQAGSGTYQAHVVVEYDLAASNGLFAAPLAQMSISSPSEGLAANTCSGSPVTIQLQDPNGNSNNASIAQNIALSGSGLSFYTDSSCGNQASGGVVTIPVGQSSIQVYVKSSVAVSTFTVSANDTTTTTLSPTSYTPPLQISPSTKTLVPGNTLSFSATGGKLPYSFSSTGGSMAGSILTAGSQGSESVTVSDANSSSSSANISVNAPVAISSSSFSIASGSTQQFSASGGVSTPYSWSSTIGSIDQTGLFTGSCSLGTSGVVKATDSAGNSASASINVTSCFPQGSDGTPALAAANNFQIQKSATAGKLRIYNLTTSSILKDNIGSFTDSVGNNKVCKVDFAALTIPATASLDLAGDCNWLVLGISGDIDIEGSLTGSNNTSLTTATSVTYSLLTPDANGNLTGAPITYTNTQVAGGSGGGVGGLNSGYYGGSYAGVGGGPGQGGTGGGQYYSTRYCMTAGGGGGGGSSASGQSGLGSTYGGFAGGSGGLGNNLGIGVGGGGGGGGSQCPYSGTLAINGFPGAAASLVLGANGVDAPTMSVCNNGCQILGTYGSGASGGNPGGHGQGLYLKVAGTLRGSGSINFAGQNGGNGGEGSNVYNTSIPALYAYGPSGGGSGGGGAGGSGGSIQIMYKHTSNTLTINYSGGNGGTSPSYFDGNNSTPVGLSGSSGPTGLESIAAY